MGEQQSYQLAADLILYIHFGFVCFVVLGLLLVIIGKFRHWQWIRNPWFRSAHLVAIGIVVLQVWLGQSCPLTLWEMALREKAGAATYPGSFIGHWVESFLYYRAPDWVFILLYSLFGLAVAFSWFWAKPRKF